MSFWKNKPTNSNIEIVITDDGSHTLYLPGLGEHYHSVYGAIRESEFIFINNCLNYSKEKNIRIFEAGFGTGLNALLTCLNAIARNRDIFYTTIEKNPLPDSIINSLNYKDLVSPEGKNIFERLHLCNWNVPERIASKFTLLKIKGDLVADEIHGSFDLVYFDAFGPDKQPEMWTDEVFKKISAITVSNSILVTYSAKGSIRRILKNNGFEVTLLPGPPGKRHMTRAIKI